MRRGAWREREFIKKKNNLFSGQNWIDDILFLLPSLQTLRLLSSLQLNFHRITLSPLPVSVKFKSRLLRLVTVSLIRESPAGANHFCRHFICLVLAVHGFSENGSLLAGFFCEIACVASLPLLKSFVSSLCSFLYWAFIEVPPLSLNCRTLALPVVISSICLAKPLLYANVSLFFHINFSRPPNLHWFLLERITFSPIGTRTFFKFAPTNLTHNRIKSGKEVVLFKNNFFPITRITESFRFFLVFSLEIS